MSEIFIIAEAGVNHNGSVDIAKKLIDAAKDAGSDAIKFQTFRTEDNITAGAEKADYQKVNDGNENSQYEMLRKLELSFDDFVELKKYADEANIMFLSTGFDRDSVEFLSKELDIPIMKVPSGEITNLPLLIAIARQHKPVIMSTGMSTPDEIGAALSVLRENGAGEITLLQCTTEYPAPVSDVNLAAMAEMRSMFGTKIGYSDHTNGIEISVAAAALGASVIEKHFTLDRGMPGPDHKASLEPDELKAMVKAIRNVELAIGDGNKSVSDSELGNRDVARKSIVAARLIKKGEELTENNLTVKRPGIGVSPMMWFDVIGTCATRDYTKDEMIDP
jgi:N,N'-diacetyllegionaminate synthase